MASPGHEDHTEIKGHWWEVLASVAGFGTAFITFCRGVQAARKTPEPASDNLQDRLTRLELRCEHMENALLEQGQAMLRMEFRSAEQSQAISRMEDRIAALCRPQSPLASAD